MYALHNTRQKSDYRKHTEVGTGPFFWTVGPGPRSSTKKGIRSRSSVLKWKWTVGPGPGPVFGPFFKWQRRDKEYLSFTLE